MQKAAAAATLFAVRWVSESSVACKLESAHRTPAVVSAGAIAMGGGVGGSGTVQVFKMFPADTS